MIRELGSPGKVAAIIKEDLKNSSQNYGEFTESGYRMSVQMMNVRCHRDVQRKAIMQNAGAVRQA